MSITPGRPKVNSAEQFKPLGSTSSFIPMFGIPQQSTVACVQSQECQQVRKEVQDCEADQTAWRTIGLPSASLSGKSRSNAWEWRMTLRSVPESSTPPNFWSLVHPTGSVQGLFWWEGTSTDMFLPTAATSNRNMHRKKIFLRKKSLFAALKSFRHQRNSKGQRHFEGQLSDRGWDINEQVTE